MNIRDNFKLDGHCQHLENGKKCYRGVSDQTVKWSTQKYGEVFCYEHSPRSLEEVMKRYKNI